MDAVASAVADASTAMRSITLLEALVTHGDDLEAHGRPSARDVRQVTTKLFGTGPWASRKAFKLKPTLPMDHLSDGIIRDLKRARALEGLKPASIAGELRVIRAAVRSATSDRKVKAPDIRWSVPVTRGKKRWLTADEFWRVFHELDHTPGADPVVNDQRQRAQDLLVALTMCGGRWSEVAKLQVDQVLPGGRLRIFGWKTDTERIVGVPKALGDVLERCANAARAAGGTYLFPSNARTTAKWRRGSNIPEVPQRSSKALRRAIDRAGVNAPEVVERLGTATIHSLRHTFASLVLQGGGTLTDVQHLLGHASITTTMVYAHLAQDAAAATGAKVIGDALGGRLIGEPA